MAALACVKDDDQAEPGKKHSSRYLNLPDGRDRQAKDPTSQSQISERMTEDRQQRAFLRNSWLKNKWLRDKRPEAEKRLDKKIARLD